MDLQHALRRAKRRSLFALTAIVVLSALLVVYSYRLGRETARLEIITERYSEEIGVEITRREAAREELDSTDRDFIEREAIETQGTPTTAEEYYILGGQALLTGDQDLAHERFTQAIRLRPDWADPYLARGRSLSVQGDYEDAIRDFTAGIQLRDDPASYAARCFARLRLMQLEDALADCDRAIAQNSRDDYWLPFHYRGFANYLLERDESAVNDWEQAGARRSEPLSKAESLENISLVYLRQRDWQAVSDNAERVNELWSESPWNCLFRGIAEQQLGNTAVAEDAFSCWTQFSIPGDLDDLNFFLPESLRRYLQPE